MFASRAASAPGRWNTFTMWNARPSFRRRFFFSSRRRHTRLQGDWSSDVCSSDLRHDADPGAVHRADRRGDAAAPPSAGHAAALSHVALSAAEPRGSARLDLHLCHDAARGGRVRAGRAGVWCRVLRTMVVERTNVAVRGTTAGDLSGENLRAHCPHAVENRVIARTTRELRSTRRATRLRHTEETTALAPRARLPTLGSFSGQLPRPW